MGNLLLVGGCVPSLSSRFLLLRLRPGERGRKTVAKLRERVEAHYEVQDVNMGEVCTWPEHSDRCRHRLLSVVPIVSIRVEGGCYAARCLLCGTTGPVRGNGEAARLVLLEQMVREEDGT